MLGLANREKATRCCLLGTHLRSDIRGRASAHCFSLLPWRVAERRVIYEVHSSYAGNMCFARRGSEIIL